MEKLEDKCRAARAASRRMAYLPTDVKNKALRLIAAALLTRSGEILFANEIDLKEGRAAGLSGVLYDRLKLSRSLLEGMSRDVLNIASLPDPVGEVFDMRTLPNGLLIGKKRVPLGVIGTIYESRPNVTIDISSLCLKSGNAVILRGGKEAIHSNAALTHLVQDACRRAGVPDGAVAFLENTDHTLVNHMLRMSAYIDLIVPRGGAPLIKFVRENSSVPVVAGGMGVCHTYVDKSADLDNAVKIVVNAKVQKPSVCNALDTVLVHRDIAASYLPGMAAELAKAGVAMHCDEQAMAILRTNDALKLVPAVAEDWGKEFLALIAAVKVVDSLDAALAHIERYGSGHSEAILTEDYSAAMRFLDEVDAACVYVNASTRFTDGGQFGLGAEIGISTQKMHARGPMGLREVTSYKWLVFGKGQARPG
ncbi:MAG: glutamate-5-semialdehyde dehydrogenase [Chloroflexota bacterium]